LQVTPASFNVYLIPETLRVTVLGLKGVGDAVNIEVEAQTQAIVDTVERMLKHHPPWLAAKAPGRGAAERSPRLAS